MKDYDFALSIIDNKIINRDYDDDFNVFSFIYKITNERLNEYKYMLNGNKALSVIASGDQIIEMIDNGIYNIDCFDISIFPKYYLMLKLAAICSLSIGEYSSFFLSTHDVSKDKLMKELYFDKIRFELEGDDREFWDKLLTVYEWSDIFNSKMFTETKIDMYSVLNRFDFFNNYNNLKNEIKKINFNYENCNIIYRYDKFKGLYDLVYLSNILDYNDVKKYKEMLKNLPLEEQGIALSYIFSKTNYYTNKFNEKEFEFVDLKSEPLRVNNSSVLIYRR